MTDSERANQEQSGASPDLAIDQKGNFNPGLEKGSSPNLENGAKSGLAERFFNGIRRGRSGEVIWNWGGRDRRVAPPIKAVCVPIYPAWTIWKLRSKIYGNIRQAWKILRGMMKAGHQKRV
ncbi:unnamed protein product [Musa banksii]